MSSTGMLSVLASDDDGNEYVAAYRSGRRLIKKYLHSKDNSLAGWYHNSIVVVSDSKPVQVPLATGELSPFAGPHDTRQVDSLAEGDMFIRYGHAETTVELRARDGKSYSWRRPILPGYYTWTVIGGRYVALSCSLIKGDTVLIAESRLWLIDLHTKMDRVMDMKPIYGLLPGRKREELLIGTYDSGFRIEALNLKSLECSTLFVSRDTRSGLVGLSIDKKWALLHTGYADIGPGYLWAVNLMTHKMTRIQENVYNCMLMSPGRRP